VASETRGEDVYAVWDRFFSRPASNDGVWAADISRHPTPRKMPGTGTNTVAHEPEPRAIASPTVRGGTYVASCNNANPCNRILLWHYGAKKNVNVPGSSSPTSVSLSAGPSGRLWIAWWSASTGTVGVVRTNEAGSSFGPVETHAGPRGCQSDGNGVIKVSSGSQQRADVILQCYGVISGNNYQNEAMATQSVVPLQIGALVKGSVKQKQGESVTYRVADVGDAVLGATVSLYGKGAPPKRVTDKKGQVTFQFAKGTKSESFRVVATMPDYLKASTALHVG